jgi:DNA-binding LacI/PurR family transcriptional regulator
MGYELNATARSLRLQKNNIIGLSVPDIDNPSIWQIIRGIESEAQSCNYNILLIDTTNPKFEKDAIREALRGRLCQL